MRNSVRAVTFVAALSICILPTVLKENSGTDPKPKRDVVVKSFVLEEFQYAVFSLFGL
jgi:hypothetical protein